MKLIPFLLLWFFCWKPFLASSWLKNNSWQRFARMTHTWQVQVWMPAFIKLFKCLRTNCKPGSHTPYTTTPVIRVSVSPIKPIPVQVLLSINYRWAITNETELWNRCEPTELTVIIIHKYWYLRAIHGAHNNITHLYTVTYTHTETHSCTQNRDTHGVCHGQQNFDAQSICRQSISMSSRE